MVAGMKIYSNIETKNTYFEVWGGSTKHPDVRHVLQWDKEGDKFVPSDLIQTVDYECFQWLTQCIADLEWGTFDLLSKLMEMAKYSFEESTIF
jgi:hypothetical protein